MSSSTGVQHIRLDISEEDVYERINTMVVESSIPYDFITLGESGIGWTLNYLGVILKVIMVNDETIDSGFLTEVNSTMPDWVYSSIYSPDEYYDALREEEVETGDIHMGLLLLVDVDRCFSDSQLRMIAERIASYAGGTIPKKGQNKFLSYFDKGVIVKKKHYSEGRFKDLEKALLS